MERHRVASRVEKSLEYQEKIIAEFLKTKKKEKTPSPETPNSPTRTHFNLEKVVTLQMSLSLPGLLTVF